MPSTRPLLLAVTAWSLVAVAAPALGGTQSAPEIADEPSDVNVELLLPAEVTALAPDDAAPAADLLAAWIASETPDQFTVQVRFADLPDAPEAVGTATETWLYFTIKGTDYRVGMRLVAKPVQTAPGDPEGEPRWTPAFFLRRGSMNTTVTGNVDTANDLAVVFVPKAAVGSPAAGDRLTRFWAVTRLGGSGPALDYGPGAVALDPTAFDPADPWVGTTPTFGLEYAFLGVGGPASDALSITIPPSASAQQGRAGLAAVTIRNDAEAADTVQIAVESAPSGWSAEVSPASLELQPGQSRAVSVSLMPDPGAADVGLLTLRITSALGADQQPAFTVQLESPPVGSGGSQTGTGDAGTVTGTGQAGGDGAGASPEEEDEGGVPGPGVAVVVAVAGAALVAGRRFRRS